MRFKSTRLQLLIGLFILIAGVSVFLSCSEDDDSGDDLVDPDNNGNGFTPGSTWLYQLQAMEINAMQNSKFTWVVMDYSFDGSASGEFSAAQIQTLRDAGITPLAYISIGEAENYRFYWNSNWVATEDSNDFTNEAPSWLGHTNPDWPGNYKVRYWDTDWRDNYINPYLDKIISQGFKGVYLDIVDAFEYWGDGSNYGTGRNQETIQPGDPVDDEAEAARRMIELVEWIAQYCRSNSPFGSDFLIFPQNGERILDYDDDQSYMNTVSGIGREDIWYDETRPNSAEDINEVLGYLRQFITNNKTVLAVDYVDDGSGYSGANKDRILDFAKKCKAEFFRYYAARSDRELNRINVIPGVQP